MSLGHSASDDPIANEGRSIVENDAIQAEHNARDGEWAIIRLGRCAGVYFDRETAERIAAMHQGRAEVVPATDAHRQDWDDRLLDELGRERGSW